MKSLVVGVCIAILVAASVQAESFGYIESDPFTDETVANVICSNDDGQWLGVRKTGDYLEIMIAFDKYIAIDELVDLVIRFDSYEPTFTSGWSSTNGMAVFVLDEEVYDLLDALKQGSRLAVRTWDYNGTKWDIVLDIEDMYQELAKVGL